MQNADRRRLLALGGMLLAAAPTVAQKPAVKRSAKIGKTAPAFTLSDSQGKSTKLSDFAGKIVVLEWINKGCPFSVKSNPTMIKTAKKHRDHDVVWLAIDSTCFNTATGNEAYRKQKGIPYPILMDSDGTVGRTYGAENTPHLFIIDKHGVLVYSGAIDNRRTKDGYRNYVAEALDLLIEGKPVEVSRTRAYGCRVKYKE